MTNEDGADARHEEFHDGEAEGTPDQFGPEEQVAEPEPSPRETYNNAVVVTPYHPKDFESRQVVISIGASKNGPIWKTRGYALPEFIHEFTIHRVGPKEGTSVVLGELVGENRNAKAVKTEDFIGLDIDTGFSIQEAVRRVTELGCLAIIYTTHSHMKGTSEFPKEEILKPFPDKNEVDTAMVRQYLRDKKNWEEYVVNSAEFIEDDFIPKGIVCRISHVPMPKFRVIVPLREPFVIAKEARTQSEAIKKWANYPEALAAKLGLPFDRSCTDPCRIFYPPRHDEGSPHETYLFGGPELLDHRDLNVEDTFENLDREFRKSGPKSHTKAGRELGKWSVHRARGFDIERVVEDHAIEKIRGSATSGQTMECPFDAEHSNPGDSLDTGFYAVNGDGNWFKADCQHANCKKYTCLDFLGKMIEDWGIPQSVLWDDNYNAIELTEEELAFGRPAPEPEVEILPTLAELKSRIAKIEDGANREVWHPLMVAIEEAHLNPTDTAAAHAALKAKLPSDVKPGTYTKEIDAYHRSKKQQEKAAKEEGPKGPDEKTIKRSDAITAELTAKFGGTFYVPSSRSGCDLHLDRIDGRPWFVKGAENTPLCTPFVYDGAAIYPDRDNNRALRVRVYDADNNVVPLEFDAELLGQHSGSELAGKMYAKGWCADEEGKAFALKHLRTQQISGPTVYHNAGCRNGVMVLATGETFAPKNAKPGRVELHADSRLKGPLKAGTLEGWKAGAAIVFKHPKGWHFQLGTLLGLVGPTLGYLCLNCVMAYLGGGTREGKTTCKKCAAAHWATPDEKGGGGYIVNARGTFNSQELTLQMGSCAVLCLDEFGKLPPKEQAEFAFLVEGGAGKRRMTDKGRERTVIHWHGLLVIVSAEYPLDHILATANEKFDPGMTARLLPITLRDTKGSFTREEFKAVEAMHDNFGHSGPEYIRTLLEMNPQGLKDRLSEIIDSLPGTSGEGSALRRSAAQNVAYIQLVAEVAVKAELIPSDYDAAPLAKKIWKEFLESGTAPIDPAERGFETLCYNLIHRKGVDIVDFAGLDNPKSRETLAFHSVPLKGEVGFFYVIPTKNLGRLSDGADEASLKRLLEDRGFLVRQPGKRGETSMTWGSVPRLGRGPFVLLRAELVDGEEDEETDIERWDSAIQRWASKMLSHGDEG